MHGYPLRSDARSVVALQCKTAEGRGSKTGLRWPGMGVECAVRSGCRGYGVAGRTSDAPRSGEWVRGAREGAGWVDQGGGGAGARRSEAVMRSAPGGQKMLLFLTSSLRLGVWWVIPGGLVRNIARPNL
jgi:hypothetical protein